MKKIKKILATIFITVILFCLCACDNNTKKNATKSLYHQGLEIVNLMSEMTQSEEYVNVYTGSSEIKSVVQNISKGEYTTPKAVYAISITDENRAAMVELGNLEGSSEELQKVLMQRVLGSVMTQINGMSGVANLAASSVCTIGKTFVNSDVIEDVIYLYTYENALPVAVTFTVGEDGSISANGVFVLYDGFTCGSVDEIKSFFSDITVDVSKVAAE